MWSAVIIVGLLAVQAASSPSRAMRKRTTETVQLYAYGVNISGLAIYAGTDSRGP